MRRNVIVSVLVLYHGVLHFVSRRKQRMRPATTRSSALPDADGKPSPFIFRGVDADVHEKALPPSSVFDAKAWPVQRQRATRRRPGTHDLTIRSAPDSQPARRAPAGRRSTGSPFRQRAMRDPTGRSPRELRGGGNNPPRSLGGGSSRSGSSQNWRPPGWRSPSDRRRGPALRAFISGAVVEE